MISLIKKKKKKKKKITSGSPRGIRVKFLDCNILERDFELRSRYYVHFRARFGFFV